MFSLTLAHLTTLLVFIVCSSGQLYCEDCYGRYLAPDCSKCRKKIIGVSLNLFWGSTFFVESKLVFESRVSLEDCLSYQEVSFISAQQSLFLKSNLDSESAADKTQSNPFQLVSTQFLTAQKKIPIKMRNMCIGF